MLVSFAVDPVLDVSHLGGDVGSGGCPFAFRTGCRASRVILDDLETGRLVGSDFLDAGLDLLGGLVVRRRGFAAVWRPVVLAAGLGRAWSWKTPWSDQDA